MGSGQIPADVKKEFPFLTPEELLNTPDYAMEDDALIVIWSNNGGATVTPYKDSIRRSQPMRVELVQVTSGLKPIGETMEGKTNYAIDCQLSPICEVLPISGTIQPDQSEKEPRSGVIRDASPVILQIPAAVVT